MLSKNKIKLLASLNRKKFREKHHLFIAEGTKLIEDLIKSSLEVTEIIATKSHLSSLRTSSINISEATPDEIKKVSSLNTAPDAIAVIKLPEYKLNINALNNQLILALDNIQDPGNMGTIIRMADWFGIKNIIASKNTVDMFNPKVVQASMGAIGRVNVFYTDLQQTLIELSNKHKLPVFGTYLEGENIYSTELPTCGVILMGNEGQGINANLENTVTTKLNIPSFPANSPTSESLNVAIATSIICSEFRRRQL